jgi:hypothetical protein
MKIQVLAHAQINGEQTLFTSFLKKMSKFNDKLRAILKIFFSVDG